MKHSDKILMQLVPLYYQVLIFLFWKLVKRAEELTDSMELPSHILHLLRALSHFDRILPPSPRIQFKKLYKKHWQVTIDNKRKIK